MAQPANEENNWTRRWLLYIRAVVDRRRFVELEHVELVPLPEWSTWLGDSVEEGGGQPLTDQAFEVTQDVTIVAVEPAAGLSVPELGLYYIDDRWVIE